MLRRQSHRSARHLARGGPLSAVVAGLLVSLILSACGGGSDDIKHIQQTATAAATRTPATTATPTPAKVSPQQLSEASTRLAASATRTMDDMLAAAQAQADPKWPAVMASDAELMDRSARELLELTPKADVAEPVKRQLDAAATKLSEAASFLKKAATTVDPALGQQAFTSLTEGQDLLTQAMASIPK